MARCYSTAADMLTASRLLLGIWFCTAAIAGWSLALKTLVILHLAGISTDILDGNLARRSPEGQGRLATWELPVDMVLYVGVAGTLCTAGYCSAIFLAGYLALATLLLVLRPSVVAAMLLMAPVAFLPAAITLIHDRSLFALYVGWALVALVLDWNRFCEHVLLVLGSFGYSAGPTGPGGRP